LLVGDGVIEWVAVLVDTGFLQDCHIGGHHNLAAETFELSFEGRDLFAFGGFGLLQRLSRGRSLVLQLCCVFGLGSLELSALHVEVRVELVEENLRVDDVK
jgi:hypothetical protein